MALELPETTEYVGKKEHSVNRNGKTMFRTRPNDSVAFRLDWETRDRVLKEQPDVFFLIDHYLGWPFALATVEKLQEDQARELIKIAWNEAPFPCKTRPEEKRAKRD